MKAEQILEAVHFFIEWAVFAMIVLVAALVLLGLVNAVVVMWRTIGSSRARHEATPDEGPLPQGIISTYTYLHLLADVLLVFVGIELIETFVVFAQRADTVEYLNGVLAAAMVALARRIIVFFNPDSPEKNVSEMYAYAALVAALAVSYAAINL